MVTYHWVGNAIRATEDMVVWTTTIQRIADAMRLQILFNKNMTTADAKNAVLKAFHEYDRKQTVITLVNNKIDTVLAGV